MQFVDPRAELNQYLLRLRVTGALVMVCFALLLLRFLWLQVFQHDYYRARAENNRITLTPVQPVRGLILDRNGVELAHSQSAFTLEIMPSMVVGDIDTMFDELNQVIRIDAHERRRFKQLMEERKSFESLPLRTRLSDEEVARVIANRYRFPGVNVEARLFRQYPQGDLASHVLGYLGRINDADQDRITNAERDEQYRGAQTIGKAGLEKHYEFELHGQPGLERVEIDAGGHPVRTLAKSAPVAGNSLQLTLDSGLQHVAEEAFGNNRGALVALDPANGGILALVSKPNFDPNLFVDDIAADDWKELNDAADKPLLNRALNGVYPPGSTFKPFMALAALEYGKRRPTQTIYDPGYFQFGDNIFRDDKVGGHGQVDMMKSLVESCDTYYYILASDLGINAIDRFMAPFGFGQKTGIDIDGESTGVLPSREWKQRRFKRPEQQKWYDGETVSIGIGQGYNAYTPIQLAQAVATLASDGVVYRPHLVSAIIDISSGRRREIVPDPLRIIPLKPENLEFIKQAMIGVNQTGTAARVFADAPYLVAGKTGTSQVYSLKGERYSADIKKELRDHALYIAYAPADKPRIALAVLVENAGFGATSAAPIARQVFDYWLLGKHPSGPARAVPNIDSSAPGAESENTENAAVEEPR